MAGTPRRSRAGVLTGLGVLVLLAASVPAGFAESWSSSVSASGTLQVGWFAPLGALVEIEPERLQLGSHGDHVTAFVRVPDADVGAIDVSTVRLCVGISACGADAVPATDPTLTRGGQVLKVEFARADVIALLGGITGPIDVVLTVSGVVSGRAFGGSDVVRVIGCGAETPLLDADEEPSPSPSPADAWPSAEPTPSTSSTG
jgi:hypothetical protein